MMMGGTNILMVLLIIVFTNLHFDFVACSNSRCREIEWQALMDFKGSLVDEGNRLSSWMGGDCCSWYGVTCHNRTGFVQMIDLRNGYIDYPKRSVELRGQINSSLLHLEHLEHLDLSHNRFSGIQIPPFLGSLTNLQYLNLSMAGFSGEIPRHLGNLSNLHHLSLGDWELNSTSLTWITGLSSLKTLEFTHVNMSGSLDWFDHVNRLSSLSSLSLYNCELVGMPLSRDLNLTSLISLDLGANNFNSAFHPILFNLSSLEDFIMDLCNLRGPIPDMFQKITSLNRLDLSDNSFDSSFPDSLCALSSLTYLNLQNSKLHGSIPLCIGNLSNLAELKMKGNVLDGSIPSELGSLTKLNQLDLSDNHLSGRLPSTLGKLIKLQRLDLSINSLTGDLSESHFEGLRSLESLDISRNDHIVINVSSQWIPQFQLRELNINFASRGLRIPFPVWLRTQNNLLTLNLRNASISGAIPDWFQTSYPYLIRFDLSKNFLTGHVPIVDVTNKSSFLSLKLSDNRFTGSIPNDLCNFHSLGGLKLANNQLIGNIPSCLGNLPLSWLDLGNNKLSGHIPIELGYLNWLIYLRLNGNKLSGEVPSSLQNLTDLITLDLGNNDLQGPIPNWIGKEFTELEHLMLQSNNFYGEISPNLCQLKSLLMLNIQDNSLIGTIPSCLGNLSNMLSKFSTAYGTWDTTLFVTTKGNELEYTFDLLNTKIISLAGNQLHGNIPNELMDLTELQSLNLSNNKLTGNIPGRIGNMKHLESLDLSMNHLSGAIPQSLAGIDGLGYLDLSFNNFSGRIPSGGHFDTFTDPSIYEGNDELCGKLLATKKCDDDLPQPKHHEIASVANDGNEIEFEWLYAGIGPGFAVGFLGVFFLLFFKSSWRHKYFRFLENVYNRF